MNPEYVPSKDLCIALKEAGFPQETEFYWVKGVDGKWHIIDKELMQIRAMTCPDIEYYSAPLTDELLKWLPKKYKIKTLIRYVFDISDGKKITLPDALAMTAIELFKEGANQ